MNLCVVAMKCSSTIVSLKALANEFIRSVKMNLRIFAALLIPPEVVKLGSEAVEIYHKALAEGEEKIPYCSMLVFPASPSPRTSILQYGIFSSPSANAL